MKPVVKRINKTFYVAFDGKEFDTEKECLAYETKELDVGAVFKNMIDNKQNIKTYDAWGGQGESTHYGKLMALLQKGADVFVFDKHFYLLYSKGGGAGMGAYPAKIIVFMLNKFGG